MANAKRLRFLQARGNPLDGAVIARGACIEMPEPWASRFIEDGTAFDEDARNAEEQPDSKPKKGKLKKDDH